MRYLYSLILVVILLLPSTALSQEGKSETTSPKSETAQPVRADELRKMAEAGNAAAQVALGVMYYLGKDVPQDNTEAVKWLRKAAEQGVPEAQSILGNMYTKGKGVPQDYTEAAKWMRKAAEQGVAEAQSLLGNMYTEGKGVPQDYTEAVKWIRKAAEQGVPEAQSLLGAMYLNGKGVAVDYVSGYMWFSLGCMGSDENAETGRKLRDEFAQEMTPSQIAEAQKRAREWWELFQKKQSDK